MMVRHNESAPPTQDTHACFIHAEAPQSRGGAAPGSGRGCSGPSPSAARELLLLLSSRSLPSLSRATSRVAWMRLCRRINCCCCWLNSGCRRNAVAAADSGMGCCTAAPPCRLLPGPGRTGQHCASNGCALLPAKPLQRRLLLLSAPG